MSDAEVFAWLESPEGLEWSRGRARNPFFEGEDTAMNLHAERSDPAEDPCGRGPVTPQEWDVLERQQRGIGRPAVPEARCHCGCEYDVQAATETSG